METTLSECKHGIPLVNGKGCVICSNRGVKKQVYVSLKRGTRDTEACRVLRKIAADLIDEVPSSPYL